MPSSGLGSVLRKCLPGVSSKTSFQVLSDLHLEYCCQYTTFHVPAQATYLILAGNIGRLLDYSLYLDFLSGVCSHFKAIFLVPGVEEYHGLSRKEAKHLLEQLQQEPCLRNRLVILDQGKAELASGLTILGCTLFPYILSRKDSESPEQHLIGQLREWSVQDCNEAHEAQSLWLRSEILALNLNPVRKPRVLVVTSQSPLCNRGPGSPGASRDERRTTNTGLLGNGIALDDIAGWVYGCDGVSMNVVINRTWLLSNQRGLVTPFEDSDTVYTRASVPRKISHARSLPSRGISFDARRVLRL